MISSGGEQGVVGGDNPGVNLPCPSVVRWNEPSDGFDGIFYLRLLTATWPAVKLPNSPPAATMAATRTGEW